MATPPQIFECAREDGVPVLAVDRVGTFAAAFRFGVFARGEWFADAIYAQQVTGGWNEMGSSGSRGEGWATPWRPPTEGWDGEALYVIGEGGLDVETEDGDDAELRVVYGFAAQRVTSIGIVGPDFDRTVSVSSPVGAFSVLLLGSGEFTVTPRDEQGNVLRTEHQFSLKPYGA